MKKITILALVVFTTSIMNSQMMLQLDGRLQGLGFISSESNSRTGGSTTKSGDGALQVAYGLGFSKAITENLVGTININKLGGRNWGGSDSLSYDATGQSWIGIEPGVNYYFNEVFDNMYVGGKLVYKQGLEDFSFSNASIMGRAGRIFSISDALKFGLEFGIGYELGFGKTVQNFKFDGPSGLNWALGAYVGYVFGSN